MPVKPAPTTPSPAATLVLLRDRACGGAEILLIQRHRASKFAGGDFVFPGGKVELDDNPDDAVDWCAGLTAREAARTLGVDDSRAALAFWIGAIREAFEEVGVLLAAGRDARPAPVAEPRFDAYRRACQKDNRAFWEMVRTERLVLATDRLTYFAHWVTPEERPLRFDTRFFVAEMPPGQTAVADEHEIIGVRWMTAEDARAAGKRGEISLRLPTERNLALFEGARSAREAIERLAGRPIAVIRPRVVKEGDVFRSLLPSDPGWY